MECAVCDGCSSKLTGAVTGRRAGPQCDTGSAAQGDGGVMEEDSERVPAPTLGLKMLELQ